MNYTQYYLHLKIRNEQKKVYKKTRKIREDMKSSKFFTFLLKLFMPKKCLLGGKI